MKLVIDDQNQIVKYVVMGDLPDETTIEYVGEVPDDFEVKFKPSFYLFEKNKIVENPDYKEPTVTIPDMGPTDQEKINAQLMLNQATQKQTQDAFNSQVLLQLAKLGGTK